MVRDLTRVTLYRAPDAGDGGGGTPPDGGAGDGSATNPPGGSKPDGEPTGDGTGDEPLGDAGKRALEEERRARKEADRELKAARAELDKVRQASMTEQEKAVAQAKAEGRTEALKDANARLTRAAIVQAGSGKVDPDFLGDLPALLELPDDVVDDDGNVDEKAVTKAIDDLLKAKPKLAATARPGPLPGAAGRPGDSGTSANDWIRQQAGLA